LSIDSNLELLISCHLSFSSPKHLTSVRPLATETSFAGIMFVVSSKRITCWTSDKHGQYGQLLFL